MENLCLRNVFTALYVVYTFSYLFTDFCGNCTTFFRAQTVIFISCFTSFYRFAVCARAVTSF